MKGKLMIDLNICKLFWSAEMLKIIVILTNLNMNQKGKVQE